MSVRVHQQIQRHVDLLSQGTDGLHGYRIAFFLPFYTSNGYNPVPKTDTLKTWNIHVLSSHGHVHLQKNSSNIQHKKSMNYVVIPLFSFIVFHTIMCFTHILGFSRYVIKKPELSIRRQEQLIMKQLMQTSMMI